MIAHRPVINRFAAELAGRLSRAAFTMKRSGLVVFASITVCVAAAQAADATSPIDAAQRNSAFTAERSVEPEKRKPVVDEALQRKRVTPDTIEKKPAALGDRRAPLELTETREKNVREKESHRPEKIEQPVSRYNQQRSRVSTSADTTKVPTVAKYQDSLTAASASNMARFPAIGAATGAKINRFVFRKNGGELADGPQRAAVTPAAGGSPLSK